MKLGACHVEDPFIQLGQVSTAFYFSYFIIIMPSISLLENTLIEYYLKESEIEQKNPSIQIPSIQRHAS
jgi:hypothetical protein